MTGGANFSELGAWELESLSARFRKFGSSPESVKAGTQPRTSSLSLETAREQAFRAVASLLNPKVLATSE